MNKEERSEIYTRTMEMLKPALDRVASDSAFRTRLEANPLEALAELHIELDPATRREMEGRRFSEFWAVRRKVLEGPIEVRDLPPRTEELESVAGGAMSTLQSPTLSSPTLSPLRRISTWTRALPARPGRTTTGTESAIMSSGSTARIRAIR